MAGRSDDEDGTASSPSTQPQVPRFSKTPRQSGEDGGRRPQRAGQPDRPADVTGPRRAPVTEPRPVLHAAAVDVAAAQPDPEGTGRRGLAAARVGAGVRGAV